jgi:hypothetical protein
MFSLALVLLFTRPEESCWNAPRKLEPGIIPCAEPRRDVARLLRRHPETSYWLSGANEMAAINTILIIVNSRGA